MDGRIVSMYKINMQIVKKLDHCFSRFLILSQWILLMFDLLLDTNKI